MLCPQRFTALGACSPRGPLRFQATRRGWATYDPQLDRALARPDSPPHRPHRVANRSCLTASVKLSALAIKEKINASTQNQALSALLFLGHKDVKTTMIYTHVLNRGGLGVRSPVDAL